MSATTTARLEARISTDLHALLKRAAELQGVGKANQAAARLVLEHHFIQPEAAGDGGDLEQAEETHGCRKGRASRGETNGNANTQAQNWPARSGFLGSGCDSN